MNRVTVDIEYTLWQSGLMNYEKDFIRRISQDLPDAFEYIPELVYEISILSCI